MAFLDDIKLDWGVSRIAHYIYKAPPEDANFVIDLCLMCKQDARWDAIVERSVLSDFNKCVLESLIRYVIAYPVRTIVRHFALRGMYNISELDLNDAMWPGVSAIMQMMPTLADKQKYYEHLRAAVERRKTELDSNLESIKDEIRAN